MRLRIAVMGAQPCRAHGRLAWRRGRPGRGTTTMRARRSRASIARKGRSPRGRRSRASIARKTRRRRVRILERRSRWADKRDEVPARRSRAQISCPGKRGPGNPRPIKKEEANPSVPKKGVKPLRHSARIPRAERTSEASDAEQKSPPGKNIGPGSRAIRLGTTHRKAICCAKPMDKRGKSWYTGEDRQSDCSPCLPAGYRRPSAKALQSWKRPTKAGSLSVTSPTFAQEHNSWTEGT